MANSQTLDKNLGQPNYYVATNYLRLVINSPELLDTLHDTFGDSYTGLLDKDYIAGDQLTPIFESLEAQGLESWVLKFGSQLGSITHGPLSFAALSAPDLLTALKVLADYSSVRSNAYAITITERDNQLTMVMRDGTQNELVGRWLLEAGVQIILRLIETIMTHPVGAYASIHFQHAEPSYAKALDQYYKVNCVYHAGENSVSIPASWGHVASPLSDQGSFRTNLAKCKELKHALCDTASISESVRFRLEHFFSECLDGNLLPSALPTLVQLSADLALSPRTLARRLEQDQSSYKLELERARKAQSKALLRDTHFSIADIAYYLAYQEPANFTRAFKKWFGCTPNTWRRQPRQATLDT